MRQRAHRITRLPRRHARTHRRNLTCHLQAQHRRGIRRRRIFPRPLHQIRAIHPRSPHPDQNLTRAHIGPRTFHYLHHLRAARSLNPNLPHHLCHRFLHKLSAGAPPTPHPLHPLILKTIPPLRSNLISSRSKPKLGQNFLVSPTACHTIADALGNLAQRTVVEIGPGKAAITDLLASRAGRLIAIELDRELAPRLRERFAARPNVEIIESDVLNVNLSTLAQPTENHSREKLLVIGNLPYYLTSDILLHLAAHEAAIDRAVLMVQREVADRVAAQPGSRDYGLLSVTVQIHGTVEKILTLPPGAFSPPPEVHSTVLRWTFQPQYHQLGVEPAPFTAFLRHCFAQKRKTLANNLRAAGWQPAEVASALHVARIAPTTRAEALTASELAAVFQQHSSAGKNLEGVISTEAP